MNLQLTETEIHALKHDAEQWRKWKSVLDAPVNRITELERELNAANERVKELETKLDRVSVNASSLLMPNICKKHQLELLPLSPQELHEHMKLEGCLSCAITASKQREAKLREGLLAIREHQVLNNQLTGRPIHRSRTIAMIDAALKETKDQ